MKKSLKIGMLFFNILQNFFIINLRSILGKIINHESRKPEKYETNRHCLPKIIFHKPKNQNRKNKTNCCNYFCKNITHLKILNALLFGNNKILLILLVFDRKFLHSFGIFNPQIRTRHKKKPSHHKKRNNKKFCRCGSSKLPKNDSQNCKQNPKNNDN